MSFIKDQTAPSSSLSAYEKHIVKYVKLIFVGLKTSQHFQQPSFRVTAIKQNVTHFFITVWTKILEVTNQAIIIMEEHI